MALVAQHRMLTITLRSMFYVLPTLMVNENHTDNAAIERQLLRRGCYAYRLIESKQALFVYHKVPLETKE